MRKVRADNNLNSPSNNLTFHNLISFQLPISRPLSPSARATGAGDSRPAKDTCWACPPGAPGAGVPACLLCIPMCREYGAGSAVKSRVLPASSVMRRRGFVMISYNKVL